MKKRYKSKIISILFVFVMLFSVCGASTLNVKAEENVPNIEIAGVLDSNRPEYVKLVKYFKRKEAMSKFWHNGVTELKKAKSYEKLGVALVNNGFEFIKDPQNADYVELGMNVLKAGVNVLLSCFGLPGGVSDAIFDGIMNWGDNPQSEVQKLQAHLDDQFEEVHKHLDDIQSDISELSTKVDDSTKKILDELSNAFEADYAKKQVISFTSSAEGNFNYTQFKNYLYGKTNGSENSYGYTQAYYNILLESIDDKAEDNIVKENYNALYKSIMSTAQHGDSAINIFYQDYLLKNEQSGRESIQRYYYDYLRANKDFLGERNAEEEALQFALDLYTTALFADHCVAMCNIYQLMSLYETYGTNLSGNEKYYYNGTSEWITYNQILQSADAIDARQAELEKQMASDVAYILNMGGSVVLEDKNEDTRVMSNFDKATYGNVQTGQKIYLNKMINSISSQFGFELDAFTFEWYSKKQYIGSNDGIFEVNGFYSTFEGVVKYKDKEIYSIPFIIADEPAFNGGSGSKEDPYVITNAEQFNLISTVKDGMNKHYILAEDIIFNSVDFLPIGNEDKPFNGSIDGNGFSIKNLTVSGNENVGLFAYIGESGVVENLNVENSEFSVVSSDYEKVYAGAIAAVNEGIISNCKIINTSVRIAVDSELLNKHLYAYAGGIAGISKGERGLVSYCKVENCTITAELERDYGSEGDKSNSTNVYAGGVAAIITENGSVNSCFVNNKTKVNASAISTCHDSFSTRHPYITVRAGGVVASYEDIARINNVWSDAIANSDYSRENTAFTGNSVTNNCSKKSDSYIPNLSDEQKESIKANDINSIIFPNQKLDYELSYSFDGAFNEEYNCYEDQLYYCDESEIRLDNLIILIDGKKVDYSIIAYYNFDTYNSNSSAPNKDNKVIINFATEYAGELIVDQLELPIVIKENAPVGLEVLVVPNKTEYNKGDTVSKAGAHIVLRFQDGSTKDVTSLVDLSCDTSSYGRKSVIVSYDKFTATYEILVKCNHVYKDEIIKPTCSTIGYTLYTCEQCLDSYKTDFTSRVAHKTIEQNGLTATCTEEGKSVDLFCTACQEVVEEGKTIPAIGHKYIDENGNINVDAGAHYCIVCGNGGEEHLFRTTEYETEVLCSCVICEYTAKFDVNSREKISKLPRIVVSNTYSLEGENEVVVYLELYSDVGITSALFSVYFGDELEFVSCSYGNILYKPSTSAFKPYLDHINISLAQANTEKPNPDYTESNTLLKLVFKTPENATKGKEYPILVVNKAENINGKTIFVDKFTSSTGEPLDFIALNGKIKVVDRLPGDVIGDGTIDLLDAVVISKYSVLEGKDKFDFVATMKQIYKSFDISFGDVNLDNLSTNADVVQILRYIVGGYEARILAKEFYVKLNYNDGTGRDDVVTATFNENGKIILDNLPIAKREGYRFDGWYYSFGKDAVKLGDNYVYQYDAIEQTLYAHWSLNSITFDGNGATDGSMQGITYGQSNNWIVNNQFIKNSTVYFDSKYSDSASCPITISHEFVGWALSPDGEVEYSKGDVIDLANGEIGNITLYAIWSIKEINLPTLSRTGYSLIGWASDDKGLNIVGEPNSSCLVSESTTFYAKWDLIEYSIVYDGNGHTSGSTLSNIIYNIEESKQLAPNGFSRTGYTFKGWKTTPDGNDVRYVDKEAVNYINTEQNGLVTLYAHWEANTYDVVFNVNAPSVTNSSSYTGKVSGNMSSLENCQYDSDITLPVNAYVVEGWIFKGWATTPSGNVVCGDGSIQINLASKDGEKINLYAVWEVDTFIVGKYVANGTIVSNTDNSKSYTVYNNTASIPQTITYSYVIIDWSKSASGINNLNKTIMLQNVKQVYLLGNSSSTYNGLNFNIKAASSSYANSLIYIDNFKLNGYISKDSGSVNLNITLECFNANSIVAPDQYSAISGITSLTIKGSGSLSIKGGNGLGGLNADSRSYTDDQKGYRGGDGADGKMAIDCSSTTIYYEGILELVGGNGGNGGKGGDITGASNQSGYKDLPDGGDGGNGGNGAAPVNLSTLSIVSDGCITLKYGNGGRGGDGGHGGDAEAHTEVKPDGKGHGGNAGNGGYGFIGGNGGDGGKGGYSFGARSSWNWGYEYYKGTSGNGGDAGDGGNSITAIKYEHGQLQSILGTVGTAGVIGSRGETDHDDPGACEGNYGVNGNPGDVGTIDNNFYELFKTKI